MQKALYLGASLLFSIAFQASVLLFPQYFQSYAWAVKYVWMACAVLWISWFVTHSGFWKQKSTSNQVPGQAITQTANPITTQTANPTVNVHIGSPAPPPRPLAPRATPNIIFLSSRTSRGLFRSVARGDETFVETGDRDNPQIVLACFRNDPVMNRPN